MKFKKIVAEGDVPAGTNMPDDQLQATDIDTKEAELILNGLKNDSWHWSGWEDYVGTRITKASGTKHMPP